MGFTGVHHAVRLRNTETFKCIMVLMKLPWNEDFPMEIYNSWECAQPPLGGDGQASS